MTDTTAPTYTFGDILELPGIPGILWLVVDRRDAAHPDEVKAELVPVHPADDTHAEPYLYGYEEPVRIGRAERTMVGIDLSYGTYHLGEYDPARLNAWGDCNSYSQSLTDAQRTLLSEAPLAVNFNLPPMSPDEIRTAYFASVREAATAAGRLEGRHLLTQSYNDVDPRILEAIDKDARAKAIEIAVEVFREKVATAINR